MSGLVLELQADAMNPKVKVSDLLRKAKAVSKKLQASEIEEWIERELAGYENVADLPAYRRIHGDLKCLNPVRGWMPLLVRDPQMAEAFSSRPMTQPVSELESLSSKGAGTLRSSFSPAQEKMLMDLMEYPLQPAMELSASAVVAILDTVRNRVLGWALDLEAKGVLGQGMTFTSAERDTANHMNTSYHFTTNIGSMTGSQIQQNSSGAHQTIAHGFDASALAALADVMMSNIDKMQLAADTRSELLAELHTLRAQAISPRPKAGIIRETLESARRILEGAAGNMLATYGPQIAALLATIPH